MRDLEIWKDIIGYEGLYMISNMGRVKSLFKRGSGNAILKMSDNGYHRVTLSVKCARTNFFVHKLIAQAFIPNPDNKLQVNHINRNKYDNRVVNLEWCTPSENTIHSYIGSHKSKVPVRLIKGDVYFDFPTMSAAARFLGLKCVSAIIQTRTGRTKTAGGYKVQFLPNQSI